ncbi:IPT/TIG domain-containing protein [Pontibacter sp. Tf4]|uniref:IPT/TIG domain-containing protein n=1 Tax=Pontibacter sp. Tf4 TaxID=2761620 RepID=UPI0016244F8C|nr:IPT/TIG domain-containing protein [Pontibacter sp. Tf4]MBB6609622.1 IPT/TIG domain-containing protein [Pontibacter sp. Tf4]
MARFYPYPYSSALIRTLLLIFLLVFIVAGYAQAQTAPTISNFSPISGPVGTEVVITGSGFATANMVYVGSEATLAFEILSDTQIKVSVPATASNGRIQVHTSVGAASSSTNFTVNGAPTISNFVPTTGPVGTPVTITGTNLEGVTSMSIAGATVTDFIVVSNTEIQLTIPTDAYSGGARVTANHGSASGSQSFTVTGTPTIVSFDPTSGPVGTTVIIKGTGFDNISSVIVGGAAVSGFTRISATEIKATVASTAAGGTVRVITSAGAGVGSGNFNVTGTPTITSLSASSARVGQEITINGLGFSGAYRVYFGSGYTDEVTIINGDQIKAVIPNTASTGKVTVYTSIGRATSANNISIEGAPVISSFSPTSGNVGTVVTIRGKNFTEANTIVFGSGSTTNFTVISDTEIEVLVPSVASSGIVRVYANSGRALSSGQFILNNAPVITSFSPTSGPVGTVVTVYGEKFTGTSSVYVGSGSTTNFTIVNDNELQVTVPATATTGKVLVRTATGQVYSTDVFNLTGAPEIYSFTPQSGAIGDVVTIKGINFTGATLVYFGSGSTNTFTIVNDTEIRVAVPTLASTGKIQVHTPNGKAYSKTNFTVTGAPVITSFTPHSGPVGTVVTVYGANFTGTSVVYIGNGSTTNFTVVNDNELTVVVPTLATSGKILIRTATGQVYSTDIFNLTGAPEIHAFSPTSGPVNTTVTITGKNFTGATLVYFGNGGTSKFDKISDTEIIVRVPTAASTGPVQVRTPNGRVYSSTNYIVTGTPVISSFTPLEGAIGTEVIVTGSNFIGLSRIYVGNGYTTNFTILSNSQIKFVVPANANDGKVMLESTNGREYSTQNYNVTDPYLNVTKPDITFNRGQSSTQEYQVSGLGLKNGQAVTINVGEASPFTISLNPGDGFGKTITLNSVANNRLNDTPVYVKYTATETDTEAEFEVQHVQTSVAQKALRVAIITPLPVELTSFTAKLTNGTVRLDWSTASEKDNSHFEIERSSGNMSNYRKVARVDSKVGTSAITINYSILLNYSSNGQTEYYRLKQVDFDGTATYSRSVAVRPNMVAKPTLIAPNPIAADSKIYLTAQQAGTAIVRVTSIRGKQIYFEQMPVQAGENALPLSKYKNLMAGIYIVTVEFDGKQEFIRIMKN